MAAGIAPPGEAMKIKTKEDRRDRIKLRIRKRVTGTTERPRLTVFRSLAHVYAQVVDDRTGRTIAAASSVEPALKAAFADGTRGGNKGGAEAIGRAIAERLKAKGITRVVFDRNGFLYHGRIKAVADAARQAGLEF
jgi:large subunit ribosomal protein L18